MLGRRVPALAVVAALVGLPYATASAQPSGRTASRTVQTSYSEPGGVTVRGSSPVLESPGAWQPSKAPENQLRVSAVDRSGWPVALAVDYQPSGTTTSISRVFCGGTTTLPIAVGSRVRVTPLAGSCPNGALSVPTSGTIAIVFTRPLPPPTIPPERRWAVIVGISQYAGNTHPTYGGRGDANAVRTALLRSGWRSDHILVLLDGQASGQAILNAMSWLAARSAPDTFTLFHYSGHVCIASRGPCPAGHTYLWGADNTFIPETSVGSVLGGVRGKAWFDFAGCESGAFDVGLHSPARLVTGSSQAHETSYEDPNWHESVWSGLVWDRGFLQGGAGAAPGRATIGQMVGYGQQQAPRVTANQPAGAQHPYVAGGDPTQTLYAPRP